MLALTSRFGRTDGVGWFFPFTQSLAGKGKAGLDSYSNLSIWYTSFDLANQIGVVAELRRCAHQGTLPDRLNSPIAFCNRRQIARNDLFDPNGQRGLGLQTGAVPVAMVANQRWLPRIGWNRSSRLPLPIRSG